MNIGTPVHQQARLTPKLGHQIFDHVVGTKKVPDGHSQQGVDGNNNCHHDQGQAPDLDVIGKENGDRAPNNGKYPDARGGDARRIIDATGRWQPKQLGKFSLFGQCAFDQFGALAGKLINEAKASLIINNIVYHKTEERHDARTVFTNDKFALRKSELLKKHIYDFLTSDSKIESDFAQALENNTEVVVYAKLPKSFSVSTPVANYNPDWAIVFDKDKVRHIYFVAETKGSDSDMDLREIERLKIHCAAEHFKEISGAEVRFEKVSSYEKLMDIVQLR